MVYSGNDRLSCRLVDVSQSGMALVAESERRPGTFLRLRFTLAGDARPTVADGVVVRHQEMGSKTKWGVRLLNPSPELLARLRRLEADEAGVSVLPELDAPRPRETGILPLDEVD